MRRARLAPALVLLLTGCSFRLSGAQDDGGSPGPEAGTPEAGPPTEAMPPPDACVSFTDQFDTCLTVVPGGDQALILDGDFSYNTDTGELRQGATISQPPHLVIAGKAGQEIDFLFASTFRVLNGRLRLDGSRAFGIAALGEVRIEGEVDLVANGAGARSGTACGSARGDNGGTDSGGAGGGGGGALRGQGGRGGPGDSDGGGPDTAGGDGGATIALPLGPLGGCPGGDGGDGDTGAGAGGRGGGAIIIASATSIVITGTGVINAGGGGGPAGGCNDCGGSGGGSGGMILLQAPSVEVDGVLAANGGSGGEGSNGQSGGGGRASAQPAPGGAGRDMFGGNGGNGSAGATLNGQTTNDLQFGGGGGGGGGAGFIAIRAFAPVTSSANAISPAFQPWPDPGGGTIGLR